MIPLRYNFRSLAERRITVLMTAGGISLAVMVLVILSGFINGMRRAVLQTAEQGSWIVLERGLNIEAGFISRAQYELLKAMPQIETDSSGRPLISPEVIAGFDPTPDNPVARVVMMRGVFPDAYVVHRAVRLVSGRWPQKGESEWVVGQNLAARFPQLMPPQEFRFGRRMWKIVGVFSDRGSMRESEAWTDLDLLLQDAHVNAAGFNSLHVRLKPGSEQAFKDALSKDTRLRIDAITEAKFYQEQTKLVGQIRSMGLVVAIVLGIGATFGGMNTMYSAVARRGREIGVLRSLGFSRSTVLGCFLTESFIIGFAGGVLGAMLALVIALLTGLNSRLMNVGTLFFAFRFSSTGFILGVLASSTIGILGGILPAWRAARAEVVDAVRAA